MKRRQRRALGGARGALVQPETAASPSVPGALGAVPEARQQRGQRDRQAAVLPLTVCAMLCGARRL